MPDELKAKLDALRVIVPRLNQVTDDASAIILRVQKLLDYELHMGIQCYSEFWSRCEMKLEKARSLAFGKLNGIQQFYVVESEYALRETEGARGEVLSEDKVPWPSCSRETKLRAFVALPKLLDSMLDKAKQLSDDADAAADVVKAMIGEQEESTKGQ